VTYKNMTGEEFKFNDTVKCVCTKVVGNLVQVRKGCGQFGSDVYFIRKFDGGLQSVENEWIQKIDLKNPQELEEPNLEYTMNGEFPETGFLIDNPKGWERKDASFSIAIIGKGEN